RQNPVRPRINGKKAGSATRSAALRVRVLAMSNVGKNEGEHVVFVNEFNHKVFNVDNPDKLKDLMGHRVAVKGNVDHAAGTIHVDEVNPLPEKGKKKAEAASMDEMHK